VADSAAGEDGKDRSAAQRIRRYLVAGLLIWLPIVVTVFVLRFLVGLMDQTLLLLPAVWRPEAVLGFGIPGLGLLLALLLLFVTGVSVTNLVGRKLVRWGEDFMQRIPVVRSIYSGAKVFTETVFTDKGQAFKQVLLVEYPRQGIWSIGFQSGEQVAEAAHRSGRNLVCVFVPTTPNPTSGFIIMVPREDTIPLDMSIDEAMRLIFTLGVVAPPWPNGRKTAAQGRLPPVAPASPAEPQRPEAPAD